MEALNGGVDVVTFSDRAHWEQWLAGHYDLHAGVWLKIAKQRSGKVSITVSDALDVALCYGWIDSQRKSHDEEYFLQKYSRRRPKSSWSKVNVDRVEALIAAGRMRAPGLAQISAARADGRWDAAYESQRNATIPHDLVAALEQDEQAKGSFELLDRTRQYAVILRLLKARTPDRRAVHLRQLIATLAAQGR